jgi:putative ABC transport system substrate-binding protein
LSDLGYVEGHNITIELRYAEGKPERLQQLAVELVDTKPDVVIAVGGDVAPFAINATQTIPVAFMTSADPEELGFVATLGRPGGNATGVTLVADEIASKRLQLLKEAAPGVSNIGFVWNPDHRDNEIGEVKRAAEVLNLQLHPVEVRGAADIDRAFPALAAAGVDAIYVVSSRHTVLNMAKIVGLATTHRMPVAGGWGAWARTGALLSYGPDVDHMVRQIANYVDLILKGAKPADLPIQRPTRFELIVNLKAAKALDLVVPPTLVASADEVIE